MGGNINPDKQRDALIGSLGEPRLRLEFDVWPDGQVSMWTHLDHGGSFEQVKVDFETIQRHLSNFISAGAMCPFCPKSTGESATREDAK